MGLKFSVGEARSTIYQTKTLIFYKLQFQTMYSASKDPGMTKQETINRTKRHPLYAKIENSKRNTDLQVIDLEMTHINLNMRESARPCADLIWCYKIKTLKLIA